MNNSPEPSLYTDPSLASDSVFNSNFLIILGIILVIIIILIIIKMKKKK